MQCVVYFFCSQGLKRNKKKGQKETIHIILGAGEDRGRLWYETTVGWLLKWLCFFVDMALKYEVAIYINIRKALEGKVHFW